MEATKEEIMKFNIESEMMEKLLKRNNSISLGILLSMMTFIIMMFGFIVTNNAAHSDIAIKQQAEINYTHSIYKHVIKPTDSLAKRNSERLDIQSMWGYSQIVRYDSLILTHDQRIKLLEKWRKRYEN
jgi:hypothetical protein